MKQLDRECGLVCAACGDLCSGDHERGVCSSPFLCVLFPEGVAVLFELCGWSDVRACSRCQKSFPKNHTLLPSEKGLFSRSCRGGVKPQPERETRRCSRFLHNNRREGRGMGGARFGCVGGVLACETKKEKRKKRDRSTGEINKFRIILTTM